MKKILITVMAIISAMAIIIGCSNQKAETTTVAETTTEAETTTVAETTTKVETTTVAETTTEPDENKDKPKELQGEWTHIFGIQDGATLEEVMNCELVDCNEISFTDEEVMTPPYERAFSCFESYLDAKCGSEARPSYFSDDWNATLVAVKEEYGKAETDITDYLIEENISNDAQPFVTARKVDDKWIATRKELRDAKKESKGYVKAGDKVYHISWDDLADLIMKNVGFGMANTVQVKLNRNTQKIGMLSTSNDLVFEVTATIVNLPKDDDYSYRYVTKDFADITFENVTSRFK